MKRVSTIVSWFVSQLTNWDLSYYFYSCYVAVEALTCESRMLDDCYSRMFYY